MFSSKSSEYETPQWLFDQLNDEFYFTLDPCATKENAKCKKYYTITDNGLVKDWGGEIVFVNPPYGREIGKWVKKAWEEFYSIHPFGFPPTIVMLLPARTDTKWFHKYIYNQAEIKFLKGRLKFKNRTFPSYKEGENNESSAPFPSMIVVFKK